MEKRALRVRKPSGDAPLAALVTEELNVCGVTRKTRQEAAWPLQFLYESDGMRGLESGPAREFGIEVEQRSGKKLIVQRAEGRSGSRVALVFVPGVKRGAAEAILIGCFSERDLNRGSAWADLVVRASVVESLYFDESGELE